jgi:hypothetical protein
MKNKRQRGLPTTRAERPGKLVLKGLQRLPVGTKEIRLLGTPKNPNSLRFLLGYMLNVKYDGKRDRAAKHMRETIEARHLYAHEQPGKEGKRLSNTAITKILNDNVHITYWQLEAFARIFEMPVGAILLLSRLISQVRDGKITKAENDIRALQQMIVRMHGILQNGEIGPEDLEAIGGAFAKISADQTEDAQLVIR